MLRILLWKLGFEWANLMRLLQPRDDERIYYFAFGANLSPRIMRQRHIGFSEVFDYTLQNAELRFTQSGFYRDHGFASADPAVGEQVYGRMYLIRKTDAARMDYYEGVPFFKSHDKVEKQDEQGLDFYYYRARTITENLKPTQEYLDYITTAYREMDCVPDAYVDAMEKTEVLDYFQLQNLTGKFVSDIERWPEVLHPVLIKYEGICRRTVKVMWNWSVLAWMIRD